MTGEGALDTISVLLAELGDDARVTLRDDLSMGFARIATARRAEGDDGRARAVLEGVVARTAVTGAAGVRATALARLESC